MPTARTPASLAASPTAFLMTLAFVNWLGFAGWNALLHNFTVEKAGFNWAEAGLTQSVREIPGFLAFTAIYWLLWFREQTLAYAALIVLALGVALTGYFPSLIGVLITTFIMSVGFHYFETMNTSLQLQLLPKADAPRLMGRIAAAGAAAQFAAYGGLAIAWWMGWRDYIWLYGTLAAICTILTLLAIYRFGRYEGKVPQRKSFILRRRYWLYYVLTFMSGGRRQLFFAFGGFLLVKKFEFSVTDMSMLLLVTSSMSAIFAPRLGALIATIGERKTIMIENMVLLAVFIGYALTSSGKVAACLFVIDGIFFTLILAQRTYFQKIGDPADMAATASVAFTINHIAAVVVPVVFGTLGLIDPSIIFWLGAGIASISLALSFLVPLAPAPGNETVLQRGTAPLPAE
jgi:predicted MFS family arabinose efflux permease